MEAMGITGIACKYQVKQVAVSTDSNPSVPTSGIKGGYQAGCWLSHPSEK